MARKSSNFRIGWRLIPPLVMPFVTVMFYWKVFAAKLDVHSLCATWGLALPMLGLVAYRGHLQELPDVMQEQSRPIDWREEPDDSSASDALKQLEKQLEPSPQPMSPLRLSTLEFFWMALVQPTRAFADLKQGLRAEILLFPCVFGLLIPFAWPVIFRAQ